MLLQLSFLICVVGFHVAGRDVRPAAHLPFFASSKKGRPKKDDPTVRVPFAALRGNLRCSLAGRAAELATRCALRSNNCGKSVHEGWRPAAPARPAPCASRHGQKGGGNGTGHRCARPRVGRVFCRAKRSDGPCRAVHPLWLRLGRGACGVSMRVAARMHRCLTCRSCLNGARSAQ